MKNAFRVLPLSMGLVLAAGLVAGTAIARPPVTSFGSPAPAPVQVQPKPAPTQPGRYAPALPPAASVPGTLYVPPEAAYRLNESDAQFVARQTVRQEELKREQAQLLQDHAQAMRRLSQVTAGRPRTAEDDQAAAQYRQFTEQAAQDAELMRSRAPGYRQPTNRPAGGSSPQGNTLPQQQR